MKFAISPIEKRDLLKAWAAISLAFAIVLAGGFSGLSLDAGFIVLFLISGLTVGIGFIAHELSHKLLAVRYGCWAEFRSFDQMLLLAIVFSLFGFVIAAPGGVFIRGRVTPEKNGKISAAGIVANLAVAGIFLLLFIAVQHPAAMAVAAYGMMINSWLALFNLIPFMGFDGSKVLAWNKLAYGALVIAGFALMFASNRISFG